MACWKIHYLYLFIDIYRWFSYWNTPKWMVYNGRSAPEMDDLEVPLFQETSIHICICAYIYIYMTHIHDYTYHFILSFRWYKSVSIPENMVNSHVSCCFHVVSSLNMLVSPAFFTHFSRHRPAAAAARNRRSRLQCRGFRARRVRIDKRGKRTWRWRMGKLQIWHEYEIDTVDRKG